MRSLLPGTNFVICVASRANSFCDIIVFEFSPRRNEPKLGVKVKYMPLMMEENSQFIIRIVSVHFLIVF